MRTLQFIIVAWTLATLIGSDTAFAQSGVVGKAAAELIDFVAKSGTKESVEQLAEMGGEKAVKDVLERAAKEGGEEMVIRAVGLTKSRGPRTLKAIQADPATMIKAIDCMPENRIAGALAEAGRDPVLIAKLVRNHGDEALELAARHPGIGSKVIEQFGDAGLKAARSLDTDDLIILAKVKGLDSLPPASREKFLRLLGDNPKAVNQAIKLAAAGTGLVLTTKIVNDLEAAVLGKDGVPGQLNRQLNVGVWMVVGVVSLSLIAYAGITLYGTWRKTSSRSG